MRCALQADRQTKTTDLNTTHLIINYILLLHNKIRFALYFDIRAAVLLGMQDGVMPGSCLSLSLQ